MRGNNFFSPDIVYYITFGKLKTMMKEADAVILFHIPFELKGNLAAAAKERKMSMTKLINRFIADCLKKKAAETGRGHLDLDSIQKVKEYMRMKHPDPIRIIDLAQYTGKTQARAARLLDYLSGSAEDSENTVTDFLVYCDDSEYPPVFGIFKDAERNFYAV
jgi:hypothetical protein